MFVFQEGQNRSNDQIDGTGMSLGSKKGVRVTGKYVPPMDWNSRGGGPSIIHGPVGTPVTPNTPTVISIGPLPHQPPEQVNDPSVDEADAGDDWTTEASCQTRLSYDKMGVPRQTMEELKTILRVSPLLSIRERHEGKPGSPYTYLHGSSTSGGGTDGRQDDGNSHRVFSTFKPHSDASRRGPRSRDSTSIQLPSTMDSSSSFRFSANTNRQPEVRTHTYVSGGSWGEIGGSHTGWWSLIRFSYTVLDRKEEIFYVEKVYIWQIIRLGMIPFCSRKTIRNYWLIKAEYWIFLIVLNIKNEHIFVFGKFIWFKTFLKVI